MYSRKRNDNEENRNISSYLDQPNQQFSEGSGDFY